MIEMKDYTFDEIVDIAATHTLAMSGTELISKCQHFIIRYDEVRTRKHIAKIIHTLLHDQNFYKNHPNTKWTELEIFNHLNKYDI